jgi:3-oxoacyl-[acyl-carrier protein] reductase
MDLEIGNRTALVCGSSKGLGRACAEALAREGVNVILNGRNLDTLNNAVSEIRAFARGEVCAVAGDVGTVEGQRALLSACGSPDILVTNNGGPKPSYLADVGQEAWLEVLEANMVAPLMLTRAVLPGMKQRRFGRIINITSAMVTTPRPHMVLSAGARAGLTAAMKGLSIEMAPYNVTINNLLPERFDTDRQHEMAEAAMQRDNISYEEARARQVQSIAAKRLGTPKEFGMTCAFLCSAFAGYISGQNIHLDGGSYPALI